MSTVVNVQEAKTRLSQLLVEAQRGADIVIARAGTPVARLVAIDTSWRRTFGPMQFELPGDFLAPLPDDELSTWE